MVKAYNMKRFLFFIFGLFLLTACDDLFHEEQISIGDIENYDRLLEATGGVYGTLADAFSDNSFYAANAKGDDINLGNFIYDEYYSTGMHGNYNSIIQDPLNESAAWESMYKVIVSTNNILGQFSPARSQSSEIKKVLGEIYLIRAYCYFKLTRTYGQIPLIGNIDIDYTVTKASYAEIYTFIENDLKMAMELLPGNNNSARIPCVTPHRGSAKALLAELYLSWAGYPAGDASKYTLAANEAGEVIDSSGYFGFTLLDDFVWLWDKAHLLNSESVFSLYLPDPSDSEFNELYWDYAWSFNTCFYVGFYSDRGTGVYYPPDMYIVTSFFPSEINFFDNFPRGYRKEVTFYTTLHFPDEIDSPYDDGSGCYHIDKIQSTRTRVGYQKFYLDATKIEYTWSFVYGEGIQDSLLCKLYVGIPRIYLFRYAHTLLTYAEAMARAGQPDAKAYECVNRIRRRARNVDLYSSSEYDLQTGLSPETFADSVVWERAWELAAEPEGRWYDLVRLEMVENLPGLRHPNETGPPDSYDKSAYFFPIPEGDIELNPDLRN